MSYHIDKTPVMLKRTPALWTFFRRLNMVKSHFYPFFVAEIHIFGIICHWKKNIHRCFVQKAPGIAGLRASMVTCGGDDLWQASFRSQTLHGGNMATERGTTFGYTNGPTQIWRVWVFLMYFAIHGHGELIILRSTQIGCKGWTSNTMLLLVCLV